MDILSYEFSLGEDIHLTVGKLLLLIVILTIASFLLRAIRRLISRKLPSNDKDKFRAVFSYIKWLIYIIIVLITLNAVGVNVTAVFAASAALLIGIGLALQTLFQDIISGVFILVDQTVHVGDIIEIDNKVGRVEEIKLRTTRAVTIDNKVLVIPNHLYLTNSLYNYTQNGTTTRENIEINVAYGTDTKLVESLLIQAASENDSVLKFPEPVVLFTDFAESSLKFKLIFTLDDSFASAFPKSDIRFKIDALFRQNNIKIPFPQRDVHIIDKKKETNG